MSLGIPNSPVSSGGNVAVIHGGISDKFDLDRLRGLDLDLVLGGRGANWADLRSVEVHDVQTGKAKAMAYVDRCAAAISQ